MLKIINGRSLSDAVYVVFDLERTGSDFDDDQPIETGEVFCDMRGKIVATHTQLILPVNTGREPEKITGREDIHHISPAMVKGKPTFIEFAARYAALLDNLILVGLGNKQDFASLKRYFLDSKIRFNPGKNIDLSTMITDSKFSDLYSDELLKILESNTEEHRALPDAKTFARCLPLVLDYFEKFPERKPSIEPCSVLPFKGLGLV